MSNIQKTLALKTVMASKPTHDSILKEKIEPVYNENELSLISSFFELFASLCFDNKEILKYWKSIEKHREKLSGILKRDVGIQVTLLDYFSNIENRLKNPKIVEMDFFEEIVKASKEDPKTGLYNIKYFKELLINEINRSKRNQFPLSLIFMDIDNFKKFNDLYGHTEGDKLIIHITKIINKIFRGEDIAARFGGDEFIILLPHCEKIRAYAVAKRFVNDINSNPFEFKNKNEYITSLSIGIASYPSDAKGEEELLKKADKALYKAKKSGKNKIMHYNKRIKINRIRL